MTEPQRCVLLVEDDRSVRRYLEVTLQRGGYQVITAEDGLEGMKYALTAKVDLVLTDAIMPQMNGRELARFIRNSPKISQLPIVLLTGEETGGLANADKKLIDAVISKPIKADELMECLEKVCQRAAPKG